MHQRDPLWDPPPPKPGLQRFLTTYHHHLQIFTCSTQSSKTPSMSSTPPRKGKKRLQPQTPTGKPPAKASRPSSPDYTAWMESQIGPKPMPTTSTPPAPSQPKASASGPSRTPPTLTRASSVTPMVEDPRTPSPDPDPIACTTL